HRYSKKGFRRINKAGDNPGLTENLKKRTVLSIAIRVLALPAPGILYHALQIILCLPAEFSPGLVGIGKAGGNIARTTRHYLVGHLATGGGFKSLDYLQHRITAASTQVIGTTTRR